MLEHLTFELLIQELVQPVVVELSVADFEVPGTVDYDTHVSVVVAAAAAAVVDVVAVAVVASVAAVVEMVVFVVGAKLAEENADAVGDGVAFAAKHVASLGAYKMRKVQQVHAFALLVLMTMAAVEIEDFVAQVMEN